MSTLVFCLEEPSARAMLQGLLPRLLPTEVQVQYIVFEGKQDMHRQLVRRLKHWLAPDSCFVVLRDQDSSDCRLLKQELRALCEAAGRPQALVRIACHELETFYLGDLAAVIGRSRGLPTRLIAITGRESASYLAVAPGVTIKTPADLKGRKVAVLKGTAYQRPFDALLADAGLSEKDVRVVNMDWPTAKAAVVSKDVDATFGGADLHLLQDKGVTLPISTKGRGPAYNIHAAVLATDDFIGKYPQVTQRLVNQVVRASRWASDESNRPALIKLFGEHSGHGTAIYQADLQGTNLKTHFSPLLDEEALAAYKSVLADGQKWGLVRQGFDVDAWAAPQFVQAAVKTQKLDGYWPQLNAQGKAQP